MRVNDCHPKTQYMKNLLYFILKGTRGPGNVVLDPEQVLAAELMVGYYSVNGRLPIGHFELDEHPGNVVAKVMRVLRQKVCEFNSRHHDVINLEPSISREGDHDDGFGVYAN